MKYVYLVELPTGKTDNAGGAVFFADKVCSSIAKAQQHFPQGAIFGWLDNTALVKAPTNAKTLGYICRKRVL